MNNAPDCQRQDDPPRYGPPNLDSWYETQRKKAAERNGRDEQSLVRVAPPPAWEPPATINVDEGQKSNAEKQEFPQEPERWGRKSKRLLPRVAGLMLAVSGIIAGIVAIPEWNKQNELAKIKNIGKRGYYADDHGSRIDIEPPRHWRDMKILTTAAQSILRDRAALSLTTDPAERILLEQRIQSNRESAANMLRNAHPFTRKILGAPDENIETLLQNQGSAPNEQPVPGDKWQQGSIHQ